MKIKIEIYALTLLATSVLFSSTSCSKFLDKEPDTELTMDMVFDNKDRVDGTLGYIYEGIPNPTGAFMAHDGWHLYADDLQINRSVNWGPWAEYEKFYGSWTPSTSFGGNYWADYPRRIRAAYLFLENVRPIDGIPPSEVDLMKAEVRFLACWYWWRLTETYGPIPFAPNQIVPQDASLTELLQPRVPLDEIVDYLDKELLEISKLLPARYAGPEKYGRATSLMVLITRARMLLFAASPLVNGNPWYSNFANADGTLLFKPGYDHEKWVKAAEACKQVVEEAESQGYALYTVYNPDGTVDPFRSTQDVYFTQPSAGNREVTFPVTNMNGYSFETYENLALANEFGGAGTLGVYQGLVDAYFMSNGLPAVTGYHSDGSPMINTESGYSEEGFSSEMEKRNTTWNEGTGVAGEVTGAGTFNMYCNREPRFYTSISYHGSWMPVGGRIFDFMYMGRDNSHQWNAPRNGYLIRRKVHPAANQRDGILHWSRPEWLSRLATNYLDYAEAVNEAYNDDASRQEALEYVNKIRVRAGVRQYTTNAARPDDPDFIQVPSTQEAVRNAVRMERRVELAVEGIRAYDVRRWKIAEEIPEMNGPLMGMDWGSNQPETFFRRTPNLDMSRVWNRAYYWMPIHIDEIDKNPTLVQAPFWN